MVKVTKIVAKSIASLMDKANLSDRPPQNESFAQEKIESKLVSSELDQIFKANDNKKSKKKIEKVEFSDRLGAVFGVTEPRPTEEQNG